MGTRGARGERAGGPGPICRSPAPGTCGSGASARWHVHRRQWTRCCGTPGPGGDGTGRWCLGRAGHPTHPREARADGMGTGWGRDGGSARCHLPPAAHQPARQAPASLKGALRGPAARNRGCQGLCSGEYRHFTLNIKRRIAFLTYRSQRGVSVDSKRGEEGARGEAGAGGEGGGRLDTAESLRARRGHALQQPSRPENIKPAKRKKGRRGRPMPGMWDVVATGWGGRGRTGWDAKGGMEIGSQRKEQTTSLKCGASALRGCPLAWHNVRSSPERESHQVYTDLPSHIYNLYWSNS